jgi:lipoprotein
MKKSHLSALPLALMLLFGWSCSHSKTPKQPAEKNCISDCYVTDSNRTAINVDSLQNIGCYNITMTWQERLLSVYTANYAGKQISEFVIGLFPPQGRKPDLKATRKVVFWGSEGKWDSKTGRVFTFPDGSDLEIGLRYLGGPDHLPQAPEPDTKLPNTPQTVMCH